MFSLYNLLKFLHITAAIVWVGGVIALAVLNARSPRQREAVALLARQSAFFGRAVIAPAAAVTLVAGIAMLAIGGGGFTLWVGWGLAGVFGSMAIGATVLRRANERMVQVSADAPADEARLAAVRHRLAAAGLANVALLLSTVWAMVFKPTL